jgi:hypothetical protein
MRVEAWLMLDDGHPHGGEFHDPDYPAFLEKPPGLNAIARKTFREYRQTTCRTIPMEKQWPMPRIRQLPRSCSSLSGDACEIIHFALLDNAPPVDSRE